MLVSDALIQFTLLKKDLTDVSFSTFLQWANIINRFAYRIIRGIDPESAIKTTSYSTVASSSPSTQALPTDFENILEWNTGFFLKDDAGNIENSRLSLTTPSQQAYGYYINGSNVIFTLPQTRNYALRYIPKIAPLTAVGDTMIIPDEYLEYVIRALDVQYTRWDEDLISEIGADPRFVNVLNELAENIRKAPDSYDMPDFSGNFVPSVNLPGYTIM